MCEVCITERSYASVLNNSFDYTFVLCSCSLLKKKSNQCKEGRIWYRML